MDPGYGVFLGVIPFQYLAYGIKGRFLVLTAVHHGQRDGRKFHGLFTLINDAGRKIPFSHIVHDPVEGMVQVGQLTFGKFLGGNVPVQGGQMADL